MRRMIARVVLVSSLAAPSAAFAAEEGAARSFVQERMSSAMELLNRDVSGDEAASTARRSELETLVRDTLDFSLLAERTLGTHWEGRSEEERSTFTSLLQELVEGSYMRELSDAPVDTESWQADIGDERVRRGRATVEGTVARRGTSHHIEIRLQERDDSWVVFDLITDDVSLEESYGESFDNIIREHGWDTLLERMRERIADL